MSSIDALQELIQNKPFPVVIEEVQGGSVALQRGVELASLPQGQLKNVHWQKIGHSQEDLLGLQIITMPTEVQTFPGLLLALSGHANHLRENGISQNYGAVVLLNVENGRKPNPFELMRIPNQLSKVMQEMNKGIPPKIGFAVTPKESISNYRAFKANEGTIRMVLGHSPNTEYFGHDAHAAMDFATIIEQ